MFSMAHWDNGGLEGDLNVYGERRGWGKKDILEGRLDVAWVYGESVQPRK